VLPWYDALGWALLPLVPLVSEPVAETAGWLLLARTAALGFGYLPARTSHAALPPGLRWLQPVIRHGITPAVLAVATVWLVVLMLRSARLRRLPEDRAPGTSQAGLAQADTRRAGTRRAGTRRAGTRQAGLAQEGTAQAEPATGAAAPEARS
jgi:hypothetical protein